MGKAIKLILTATLVIFSFSFAQATCDTDFKSSCESALSAMDYYNALTAELETHIKNCENGKCARFNKEMKRVNSCLQEAIVHHNTACSVGFNDEMDSEIMISEESVVDPKSKLAMLEN